MKGLEMTENEEWLKELGVLSRREDDLVAAANGVVQANLD